MFGFVDVPSIEQENPWEVSAEVASVFSMPFLT